ncbi:MAG: histidine kinase [Eubacteriales bacterium]|nr:histidine kinase [Eubacteriales bacterium]
MTDYYLNALNVGCAVFGILLSLLVMATTYSYKNREEHWAELDEWQTLIMLHTAALLCDACFYGFNGRAGTAARILNPMSVWGECLLNGLWLLTYTKALRKNIGQMRLTRVWKYITHGTAVLYGLMLLINCFNGILFYFDGQNLYHRGVYYWQAQGLVFLVEIGNLLVLFICEKHMAWNHWVAYLMFAMAPGIGAMLQLLNYGVSYTYLATTIAMVALWSMIQNDSLNLLIRQERTLSEMKMNAMGEQLQPQYLYNILGVIAQLEGTPTETRNALMDFSRYLRGNMELLGNRDLIPFAGELNHIRTYVSLEQLRFEEKLQMEYDIETVDFMVPALSVQMMVENAIKHGITPKDGQGRIRLSVRKTGKMIGITVEDDGVGFDTSLKKNDGRTHVGLESTRERLRILSKGTMDINSEIGKGTKVVIQIPEGGKRI